VAAAAAVKGRLQPTDRPPQPPQAETTAPTSTVDDWLARAASAAPYLWLAGAVLLVGIAIGRGLAVGRELRRSPSHRLRFNCPA